MKNQGKIFRKLVEREFLYTTKDGTSTKIYVAISKPYKIADSSLDDVKAGCQFLLCDDPDLATEVPGTDEWEALHGAICTVEFYLLELSRRKGVTLTYLDGSKYGLGSPMILQLEEQISRKRERIAKGKNGSA
jgi:hypothetical protein